MTHKEIKAVQDKSLEILLYFKQFCQEHDLCFYLFAGSCLGAVRHKGFVPWDDDIDVVMLRRDYERLRDLWTKFADTNKYSYCRSDKYVNIHQTTSKIQDNNTTFINEHSKDFDINHGMMIDVCPLDACPNSKIERYKQMFFAMFFALFNAQRLPDNQGKFTRVLAKIILSVISSPALRYKIWKYSEKQMSKYKIEDCDYLKELGTGIRYMKRLYPKAMYREAVYKEFEGYQMPLPTMYEDYLKMAYGDYMTPPPADKRVPNHKTVYTNMNESYKNFKGIYYCVEKKENKK